MKDGLTLPPYDPNYVPSGKNTPDNPYYAKTRHTQIPQQSDSPSQFSSQTPVKPTNTRLPGITPTTAIVDDQKLSRVPGRYSGYPIPAVTWVWRKGTTTIAGSANKNTLDLAGIDAVGTNYNVFETAANSEGSVTAASANASAVLRPEAVFALRDQSFEQNTGVQTYNITPHVQTNGNTLGYALVDEPTGVTMVGKIISIDTTVVPVGSVEITVASSDEYTRAVGDSFTLEITAVLAPPVNTVKPAVTPVIGVTGQLLTGTYGTWTGIPAPMLRGQWQRNNANIPGATELTYTATVAGDYRFAVTGTNSQGFATVNSNMARIANAGVDCVLTVRTTTANETVTIPCQDVGTFDATIVSLTAAEPHKSGVQILAYNSPNLTLTFPNAGDHTVTIYGTFPNFYFNNSGDKAKLIAIPSLGQTGLLTLENAFYGCNNLVSCAGGDTSQVTSMAAAYRSCVKLTSLNVDTWTTPVLKSLFRAFQRTAFTVPPKFGRFDTSQVQNMQYMLEGTPKLNYPVSDWKITGLNASNRLTGFLANSGLPTSRYNLLLQNWEGQVGRRNDLAPDFGDSKYTPGTTADTARMALVNSGWTITDGGPTSTDKGIHVDPMPDLPANVTYDAGADLYTVDGQQSGALVMSSGPVRLPGGSVTIKWILVSVSAGWMRTNAGTNGSIYDTPGEYTDNYTSAGNVDYQFRTSSNFAGTFRAVKVTLDDEPVPPANVQIGFGAGATGGTEDYKVTNTDDSGPGSLRAGAEAGNKNITFDVNGKIRLTKVLKPANNTTINGRGADIEITGEGITFINRDNLIVTNLKILDVKQDCFSVINSTNVYADHLTVGRTKFEYKGDGAFDVVDGSVGVTMSYVKLQNFNKTSLHGNNNADTMDMATKTTMSHCLFVDCEQRQPFVRYARRFHIFNCVFQRWGTDTGGGECTNCFFDAQLAIENCIYDPDKNKLAIEWTTNTIPNDPGNVKVTGALLQNGANAPSRNSQNVFNPRNEYDYTLETANTDLKTKVVNEAGWQPANYWS